MSLYVTDLLRGDRAAVDLAYVGHDFVTRSSKSPTIAGFRPAATSEYGYDGQFSLFIAADPTGARDYLDMPSYRLQRIGYPMVARALALGNPDLIPYALIAVNLVAVAVGTFALAIFLARRQRSPWLALVFGLYPGVAFSLGRDLTEPMAYALVACAAAVYCRDSRKRTIAAAALFAAAALTREATLIFALAYAASLLLGGRPYPWRRALLLTSVAVGPYLAWTSFLFVSVGMSDGFGSDTPPYPFAGALAAVPLDLEQTISVVFPALLVAALTIAAALRFRARPEILALGANVVGFVLFLPGQAWIDWAATGRITTGVVLASVLAAPYWLSLVPRLVYATAVALWLFPLGTLMLGSGPLIPPL